MALRLGEEREDEGALIEKRSLFRELVLALRDALRQHRARSGVLELAQMISDYPSPRHAAPTQLEVHRALLAALAENQPLVELDDRLPLTPRHARSTSPRRAPSRSAGCRGG